MILPHRIAAQFFNRPLLLTETSARTISSFLLSRFEMRRGAGGDHNAGTTTQAWAGQQQPDGSVEFHSPRASRFVGEYRTGPDGRPTPYRVTENGTAIVSVIGELVNRGAWVGASSGLVSYEGLAHSLRTAASDPQIRSVLLDLETPGGEAVGCFEVASLVRKIRDEKPVIAVANGLAASAGYALAASASRIVTIPTGQLGSIGVVMLHLDISEYLAAEGVKPTLIFAGAHKADGNPYEPLPSAIRSKFQSEIDRFHSMFVQSVAAGRRGLSEAAIRGTDADIFLGREAIKAGLADELGTLEEAVDSLTSRRARSSQAIASLITPAVSASAPQGVPAMTAPTPAPKVSPIVLLARQRAEEARARASAQADGGAAAQSPSPTGSTSPLVRLAQARADRANRGRSAL
ncbi:S49 family peptidase [Chelatococcus asaccharovorans]|uniref:S49 family peptidase n=1 Tax=Chelatococcus asaccharovorans TaxID=28210 RepID=UPI00224C7AA0|nr:S49 family peptidase [Chelatococcus asaccharovorans]CAH1649827.1 Peptidase S49 [Chelatococcus asaccharovorans]CAH1686886.1 Peptidase S49 [Chelatococcus asaccharovorans]